MKKLYPIIDFFFKLLGKFSNLIKKDANKMIIGANYGHYYTDNPRYFFEFMENSEHMDVLFISKNKQLIQELNHPKCAYSYTWKAAKHFLKSKTIVCGGTIDIFPFHRSENQFVINQWHGIPIKKIGTYSGRKMDSSWFNFILASSDFEKHILAKAFNIEEHQVKTIGTPRNDVLIGKTSQTKNEKLNILYVPTFRDNGHTDYFNFPDYNSQELNDFCSKNNIHIKVKPHLHDYRAGNNKLKFDELTEVEVVFDPQLDFQELLVEADLLITDYSGVYFDYLLLERPIFFFPYDKEEYGNTRGFIYDYDEHSPGPHILTQKEFIQNLEDIIAGKDEYQAQRVQMKNTFHLHQDGKNAERLITFIKENI